MRRVGLMVMVVALVVVESGVPAGSQAQPRVSVAIRHAVPVLEVQASATDLAAGTRVRVTISGGGGESRELFSGRVGNNWDRVLPVEPCALGGSDLPGAQYVARIEAATGESLENPFPLFPDTAPPRFLEPTFDASPPPGDQVEAGDEISFEVTAVEKNPPKVWQTGVHRLEVTGPHGPIGRPQQAGPNAKACEAKSKSLTVQSSYRVRRSDPAVIELCAVAKDYAPNENKKCAKWYKGEVWEGTFSGVIPIGSIDICGSTFEGTITLVVSKDDHVSGTAQWMYTSNTGPDEQCNMPITETFMFPVLGSATRDAFKISPPFASLAEVRIPKSGTRAQRESFPGSQGEVYSVELRCVSC